MRAGVVTQADLEALNAALEAIAHADDAVSTVQGMCREKGDGDRAGRLKIVRFRLDEARKIAENCFR